MVDLRSFGKKREKCKLCDNKRPLSRRGFCKSCSTKLNQDSVSQLRVKRGPVYERWRVGLRRYFELE